MTAARAVLTVADVEDGFALTARPALRWRTETTASGWLQAAAELRVERHGTTRILPVSDSRSARAAWPDEPLAARETAVLAVRTIGEDGAHSAWSEPVVLTGGTLDEHGWTAPFIGADHDDPVLLRGGFAVDSPVRRATLHLSAFGTVTARINGARVGDRELAPGWTSYQWRVDADVHDVTALLRPGANMLGLELAGGWFTEAYGFRDAARRFYEGPPSASAMLVVEHEDGSVVRTGTGPSWRVARGASRAASLYQGEAFDARLALPGWSEPGASDDGWAPVRVQRVGVAPTPRIDQPVRVTETVAPVSIEQMDDGTHLVDFGQNLVGRLRIAVDAPAGAEIRMRHAEVLEHGRLARRTLRNAAAEDVYIADGEGRAVWEPSGTFHGFRYAEIDGWPGELRADAVSARVLGTDLPRTGGFRTSHPLVDRLHRNVVWGARGNFLSIPTDCPQRDERLGWTGDVQVFAPAAAFLFDSERFLRSWLVDVRHEQEAAAGIVPMVVPAVIPQVPGLFLPIAAWGDAITVVPTVLHDTTGDDASLRLAFEGMRRWVDLLLERAGDGLLWEDGRQFGDWLHPDAPPDDPGRAPTDPDVVATAYLFRSASLTARAAELLGEEGHAERYAAVADDVRRAFLDAYVTADGRMMSDAVTAYALAIVFGIAEGDLAERMGRRLRHLVRRGGYRIDTGFVGTPIVCDALTATGHEDAAARLLLQTENPSWLYPVTMGATTVWERWDSMLEDGSVNPGQMTSFNHFALGGVADWLHRAVGGVSPLEPGFARFRFAPRVLPGLDDASVWHDCLHGRIEGGWRRDGDLVQLELVVPPNTVALVELPDGRELEVGSGQHRWSAQAPAAPTATGAPSLDGPMTDVVDRPDAYRVVMDGLAEWDANFAARFRRRVRWTPGRTLRDPLDKVPVAVMERIEERLQELG